MKTSPTKKGYPYEGKRGLQDTKKTDPKKKVSPYYNQNTKHKGRPIRNTPDFQWNT